MALKKLNQTTMRGLMSLIKFTNKQFHSIKRTHQDAKLKSKKTISVSNNNAAVSLDDQAGNASKENVPEETVEKKSEKVSDNGLTDWFSRQQMENSKREIGAGDKNSDISIPIPKEILVSSSLDNALVPILEEPAPIKVSKNSKNETEPPVPTLDIKVNSNFMSMQKPRNQPFPWPSYSDRMKQRHQPNPLKTLPKREYSTTSTRKKIDAQVKSVMEEWINNSPNNIFRIDQLHNASHLVPESINPSKEKIEAVAKEKEIKMQRNKRAWVSKSADDSKNDMLNEWYRHTYKRYVNLNRLAKKAQEEKASKSKKKEKEIITTYENKKYFKPEKKLKSPDADKPLPRLIKRNDDLSSNYPAEIEEEMVVRMDDDKDLYKKKLLPTLKVGKCPEVKTRELKVVPMRRIKRTQFSGQVQVMDFSESGDDPERADDYLENDENRRKLPSIP